MMSPRSFLLAHRQSQHPPSSDTTSRTTTTTPSSLLFTSPSTSPPPPTTPLYLRTSRPSNSVAAPPATISSTRWSPKYDEGRSDVTVTITPVRPVLDATMGKRKDRRETSCLSPSSPPTTTTSLTTRPSTPTSPVRIPTTKRDYFQPHPQKRHSSHSQRSRTRDARSPDSLSPSLAALLAVTDIPRPRQIQSQRRRRRAHRSSVTTDGSSLTADDLLDRQNASEKDLSWSLSRNPLDMLLSPPEEPTENDDDSVSECNIGSALSTRTISVDSIPSLGDSFTTDPFLSPRTPSPSSRGRRFSPMRKSLQPLLSPTGIPDTHPLAVENLDLDELDFRVFQRPETQTSKPPMLQPFKPLKSAFKSNLTASLRALRSAAKSFSAINFPSIPPDDFLTRSILTIDPNVPYTDERRPPVSEEIPSAAMRRYLNPTTNARIETPPTNVSSGTFAASIQMRTYKIQRSRSIPPSSRNQYPSTSLQTTPAPQQPQPQAPNQTAFAYPPGMRQREMRENSDFIRIAVMEMAMRKRGKLDDQRPGRAKWALPPRKMTIPDEIAPDGIPVRWIPITC
ncbi:hypothetical protein G7046_g6076 [Stylonectria norvegica]|nr:hypothetical protein G7046_g6076 [Stylonectria norvegica]